MLKDKKILAIIPARKGSKGLPNKNTHQFMNRYLVEWSIDAALKSKHIDFTVVSSDSPVIKQIVNIYRESEKYRNKLGFIDRPPELSTDNSSTEDTITHVIKKLEQNNIVFDYICLLQPTSPIRRNNLIDYAINKIYSENTDSLLTVNKYAPFFWHKGEGDILPLYDPLERPMRQNIDPMDLMFYENGNIYITDWNIYNKLKCRIGQNPSLLEIERPDSYQIDDIIDIYQMESVLRKTKQNPLTVKEKGISDIFD